MKLAEAMHRLEACGTAQNRKVYARHGVRAKMFGVSYANQGKLKKAIGVDHALAQKLWATGNHDACVLATLIADPDASTAKELAAWARTLDSYVVTDALAGVVARSRHAPSLAKRWMKAKDEWTSTLGWGVFTGLVQGPIDVDDGTLEEGLAEIEARIHTAPNRTRYAMNNALIAIGCVPRFTARATAAAKRIGAVEVDHGETGCKTPDAASYIKKVLAHQKSRRKKA